MSESKHTSHCLAFEEFQQLMTTADVSLIDVRSHSEHDRFNIGGICIPMPELSSRLTELNPAKTILVYCAKGIRSQAAVNILLAANFKNVYSLEHGISSLEF